MNTFSKIILTFFIILILTFLSAGLRNIRANAGYHTNGPIGIILVAGAIGGIRAIWRASNDNDDDNNDKDSSSILQE